MTHSELCARHLLIAILRSLKAGISHVVFSGGSEMPQEVISELPTLPDGFTVPPCETKWVIRVSAACYMLAISNPCL